MDQKAFLATSFIELGILSVYVTMYTAIFSYDFVQKGNAQLRKELCSLFCGGYAVKTTENYIVRIEETVKMV